MDFTFTVTIMKLKKLTQLNLSPIRIRNQRMLAIKRMLRAKSRKAIGIGVVMPLASLSSCLLLIEVYTPLSPSQPYKYREDNTKQVEHASLSLSLVSLQKDPKMSQSIHISSSKRFRLFYIKNLLFLFYTIIFTKHPHQFIYSITPLI